MTPDLARTTDTAGLAVADQRAAAARLQARMDTILDVMARVLEDGKDYGRIPGTDKPTLFKPGGEKLCLVFELTPADPDVCDLSTTDEVRYRLTVPILAKDGRALAVGIGEASTAEEKYRWRRPVCDEEFDDTPADLRREKWFRGKSGQPNFKGKQIRTTPADLANTVLKMAHKRAFLHGTLLATGASAVFNQDLEDFQDELAEVISGESAESKPDTRRVRRASESGQRPPSNDKRIDVASTPPRKVRDVREAKDSKQKPFWVVVLDGDSTEYTTRNHAHAVDLEKFKGTDHLIRISYSTNDWQGKTYHNLENVAIADAPTDKPTDQLTAGDIPFGR